MDDTTAQQRLFGGTVEPLKRAATPKDRSQAVQPTPDAPGRRYELYDPFAGVTHRAATFDEMTIKADRAQAIRFVAVDVNETRTQVHKVDGQWQRPAPELTKVVNRDEAVRATKPVAEVRRDGQDASAQSPARPEKVARSLPPAAERDAVPVRPAVAPDRSAQLAQIEAALNERYVIKRAGLKVGHLQIGDTEYRFRGDTSRVAFIESAARLATDTNNPSVARSMVDVAQARNWQALRVSGNEDFKRMVWLEAMVRNVKTVGYEPAPADLELLRKERDARQVNRIEPLGGRTGHSTNGAAAKAPKQSERGSGGRKVVLAALEAVLVDRKVPAKQREAVMAAAAENLATRVAAGQTHKVKVYDQAAPPQRVAAISVPEQQRARERVTPAQTR
jgi:hypothetical protein